MIPEARLQEIETRARSHNMSDGEYTRHFFDLVAEVRRQRLAMKGADTALGNAEQEATHGQTASFTFVMRCVDAARAALTEESERTP